jgi:hypothetical protein
LSSKIIDKCASTNCWLFVYSSEQLLKIIWFFFFSLFIKSRPIVFFYQSLY